MGFFISIRVIIEIPHFNSLHICNKKKNMEDFLILLTALNVVLKIIKSVTDLIRMPKKKDP